MKRTWDVVENSLYFSISHMKRVKIHENIWWADLRKLKD